jgi:hypothetical protein
MATKTVTVISSICIRCGGAAGPEVIPGDTVKLFLDQDTIPAFPEWVEGTIVAIAPQTESSTGPKHYLIQYEVADLQESAAQLRDCDIISVLCEGCCKIINDYLTLVDGVNRPNVSLSYTWNEDGTITLQATAYSTRIVSQPGEQATIASYAFTNPDADVIPADGDPDSRIIEPADTGDADWPGGYYSVVVTDSEGLANSAFIWVAPKPRFRRVTVTLAEGETTVEVELEDGEEIISIMAGHSTLGFFQFAPTEADASVIEASAAPEGGDLPLKVLIHIP